jgi:DNA-binding NtrC family response regulator
VEKKSILLVDPDRESSRNIMVGLVKAGHSVTETSRADYALKIVRNRTFDVAIVDVLTSRVGEEDLITLLRKEWTDPLIIATADFSALSVKKAVIGRGANHFLNKPIDVNQLLDLISPPSGFSGQVEGVDILEYLQFMLLTGTKTIVEVRSQAGHLCRLYLDSGNVVHADDGQIKGEDAVYRSLSFKGGKFSNLPWAEPEQRTINKPGDFLLMEAARRRDEY